MVLDIRTDKHARYYKLYDSTTNKEIPFAFWADDRAGTYRVYNNDGAHIVMDKDGAIPEIEHQGNIRLIRIE